MTFPDDLLNTIADAFESRGVFNASAGVNVLRAPLSAIMKARAAARSAGISQDEVKDLRVRDYYAIGVGQVPGGYLLFPDVILLEGLGEVNKFAGRCIADLGLPIAFQSLEPQMHTARVSLSSTGKATFQLSATKEKENELDTAYYALNVYVFKTHDAAMAELDKATHSLRTAPRITGLVRK